jgi:hypothetical protein
MPNGLRNLQPALRGTVRYLNVLIDTCREVTRRTQWPRGLRRGSAAGRLLGFRVRIPPMVWMFVSCECCVLPGRDFSY